MTLYFCDCGTFSISSNFGPRGDCRGDFCPLARRPSRTGQRLPILHRRAGMNRNSHYPLRPAFLCRASTPPSRIVRRCDRRRPVMCGLTGRRARLIQLSRRHVQPLAQRRWPVHGRASFGCNGSYCPMPPTKCDVSALERYGWAQIARHLRTRAGAIAPSPPPPVTAPETVVVPLTGLAGDRLGEHQDLWGVRYGWHGNRHLTE
jgi:hypothetical protein